MKSQNKYCTKCRGVGTFIALGGIPSPCDECKGKGKVEKLEDVDTESFLKKKVLEDENVDNQKTNQDKLHEESVHGTPKKRGRPKASSSYS